MLGRHRVLIEAEAKYLTRMCCRRGELTRQAEVTPPSCREREHFIPTQPSQPVRSLRLVVSSIRNPVRTGEIARELKLQRSNDIGTIIPIALAPSREVIRMRHPIALLAVAPAICQHEIMPQVNRVLRPRDEMIDMAAITSNPLVAIEAPAVLQIHQHRPDRSQCIPFCAEQELPKI